MTVLSAENINAVGVDNVALRASAEDAEDGDLAEQVAWTSSRDGFLGVGANLETQLSSGTHTISARVVDSTGLGAEDAADLFVQQSRNFIQLSESSSDASPILIQGDTTIPSDLVDEVIVTLAARSSVPPTLDLSSPSGNAIPEFFLTFWDSRVARFESNAPLSTGDYTAQVSVPDSTSIVSFSIADPPTETDDPETGGPSLGDLNLDGRVSFGDMAILASNFGRTDASLQDGDLNGDGTVGFGDFAILAKNFGREVEVPDDNNPPVLNNAFANPIVLVEQTFVFSIPRDTFADPDGDPLTLSASAFAFPDWLSFDETTESFVGTPPAELRLFSSAPITLTASDGQDSVSTEIRFIMIAEGDVIPGLGPDPDPDPNPGVPIALSDNFFADPSVEVAADGSEATLVEDELLSPILLSNDPGLGDADVIIPGPGTIVEFDYEFIEVAGNDDEFGAFIIDAATGLSAGLEFFTDASSAGSIRFDLSSLVDLTLGLQFQLTSLPGDTSFDSVVRISNLTLMETT